MKWKGVRKTVKLPVWGWLLKALARILPIQMTEWDSFSIKKLHFDHEPISPPERFGLKSFAPTLLDVLSESGLPKYLRRPKRG